MFESYSKCAQILIFYKKNLNQYIYIKHGRIPIRRC